MLHLSVQTETLPQILGDRNYLVVVFQSHSGFSGQSAKQV